MATRNRLLAALTEDDRNFLCASMEEVELSQGLELSLPDMPAEACYFPDSGIISTVLVSPQGRQAEVGVIGREGMSPVSAVLGSDRNPYRAVIQIAGRGWRIGHDSLARMMEERPEMRRILFRWAQAFIAQVAYTALSNSSHSVDIRLARWLLMCQDRVGGDEIDLTHEFLSIMLAVRRPSVTTSLHVLEGHGLIRSLRRKIVIRDRKALESFAADAYGGSEREYARLLSSRG